MKSISLLLTCSLTLAMLCQGCGESAPEAIDSYAQLEQAKTNARELQCACLVSKGEYVTDAECLAERDAKPAGQWLTCAEDTVNTGDFSAAMLCYAEKFDATQACIAEADCTSATYSLSVAACFSAADNDALNTCPNLQAALDAIAAACDGGEVTEGGAAPGSLPLGALCLDDEECISGECLESEYGAPFCTRSCDEPQVDCPAGDDAGIGEALCVSFAEDQLPFPELVDNFDGEMDTFCVPRCQDVKACREGNESWETCTSPKYKGNVIYPGLGTGGNICQSPSHHGKDPVDPSSCNYEKTIGSFGGEASLCSFYCDFLETCFFIEKDTFPSGCCEWGCFSRMVPEGDEVDDAWYDEVKCFIDDHNAWPAVGVDNACNHPPKACGGTPEDPTHPAAVPL